MKHFLTFVLCVVLFCTRAFPQNIGINANGATPNSSSMLDIDVSAVVGTKKGLLVPRMTAAERDAIPSPAQSLLVFSTTDNHFYYRDGVVWRCLCGDHIRTISPEPVYPSHSNSDILVNNTMTGYVGMFHLVSPMLINSVTFWINSVNTAGMLRMGIYSEDGQTKMLDQVTGAISGASAYTQSLSATIFLASANYYLVVVPAAVTNISLHTYHCFTTSNGSEYNISGKPKWVGVISVPAGTLPASFNPVTDVTYVDDLHGLVIVRFDYY